MFSKLKRDFPLPCVAEVYPSENLNVKLPKNFLKNGRKTKKTN